MLSRQKNDCVPCAVAEYLNADYDTVLQDLRLLDINAVTLERGTSLTALYNYIKDYRGVGLQQTKVSGRGGISNTFTGLLVVRHRTGTHMVCVKFGWVIDNDGVECNIKDYLRKNRTYVVIQKIVC